MQQSNTQRLTVEVRGRVQGVGYRVFARDLARSLKLSGYVRNQADSSVLVMAVGGRATLEQLLIGLRRGPGMSRVEQVITNWSDAPDSMAFDGDFEVQA